MKRSEIEKYASCYTDDTELLFQQIDIEAEKRKTQNEQIKGLEEKLPKTKEDNPICDKTDRGLNISIEVGKQYIDKQDLLKWCENISFVMNGGSANSGILKDFVEIVIIPGIKIIKPANVKEVRYGEWIPSRDKEGLYVEKCSECDYIEKYNIDPNNKISMPYCPKCGAKMTAPWRV